MKYFIKTRQSPIAKFSRCYGQLAPVTAVYLEQKAKNIGKELAPTSLGKNETKKSSE